MGEISQKHILLQYVRKNVEQSHSPIWYFALESNYSQIIKNSWAEAKWPSFRIVKKELSAVAISETFEIPFLFECSVIQKSFTPSHELVAKPPAVHLPARCSLCQVLAPVITNINMYCSFTSHNFLVPKEPQMWVVLDYKAAISE